MLSLFQIVDINFVHHCHILLCVRLCLAKLLQSLTVLRFVRHLPMPCSLIFHEGDAFSLDGLGENGGGLSFDPACELEGGLQLCKIVTIDCQNLRAKSRNFASIGYGELTSCSVPSLWI